MKTLAERLIWSRKQKQLSQSELADMVGVVQSTIGNLEAGSRFFSRKITSIAAVLGVNARWLAEGTGQPCDDKKSKEARPISHQEQVILELIAALPESDQKKMIVVLKKKKKEYDVLFEELSKTKRKLAKRLRYAQEKHQSAYFGEDDQSIRLKVNRISVGLGVPLNLPPFLISTPQAAPAARRA